MIGWALNKLRLQQNTALELHIRDDATQSSQQQAKQPIEDKERTVVIMSEVAQRARIKLKLKLNISGVFKIKSQKHSELVDHSRDRLNPWPPLTRPCVISRLDVDAKISSMNITLPQLTIQTFLNPFEIYSDQREHGYKGSSRYVRLPRVTPAGGGLIARSEDAVRCAVTGKECMSDGCSNLVKALTMSVLALRILHVSEPSQGGPNEHKFAIGQGGHRIDASRNFWESSGLKIDSASTDIAWAHGRMSISRFCIVFLMCQSALSNKILTTARNGELIMWDINKSGASKLGASSPFNGETTFLKCFKNGEQRTIFALSTRCLCPMLWTIIV